MEEHFTKERNVEEQSVKEKKTEEKLLQWHSAFYAGLQIELSEEAEKLIYEREHTLGTKPMLIDILIIKKNSNDKIKKNIGCIFRKYNIVEYKSPQDYLSIDDFYKVYGYGCFYKSQGEKQNERKIEDLTITFVSYHYPREFLKHLKEIQGIRIEEYDKGIYYLVGDTIPMQVIVTSRLSEEQNLWLRRLTNQLKRDEAADLVKEYKKYQNDPLYKSVMELIVQANNETFREAKKMCNALMELFKEEFEERESIALQQGIEQGIEQGMGIIICNALRNGHTPEQISEFNGISLDEVLAVQLLINQGKL